MADQLTAKEHEERILSSQDRLILRIQSITNAAVAVLESDDPRAIEHHLEELRQRRFSWQEDNEEFFSTIEHALVQLVLNPAVQAEPPSTEGAK